MRRLPRILLNAATVLSLVLCLATVAMWGRSFFASDRLFRQAWFDEDGKSYWIQDTVLSGRGGVGIGRIVQSWTTAPLPSGRTIRQLTEVSDGNAPFRSSGPPTYPDFRVGVGDLPVWGGFKRGGFSHSDAPGRRLPRAYGWQVVVPYWAIVPPLALLPTVRVVLWSRRRRRVIAGQCSACGYDLRATPERCPECGTDAAIASIRNGV